MLLRTFFAFGMALLVMVDAARAETGYKLPPAEVVDILDAKPEPSVSISPDGKWMLFLDRDAMPLITDLSRRMLQLAGTRIDPVANGPFASDFIRGISLRSRTGSELIRLPLPADIRIGQVRWSHRSDAWLYTVVTDQGTELWLAKVTSPTEPVKLTDRLSTVLAGFDWMPDGESILCNLVPQSRPAEPAAPRAPFGPSIQESMGNKSPTRTYQDLLTNPHDENLFEYYGTSQLTLIDLQGKATAIGSPGLIGGAIPSPDGKYLLVTSVKRPFSYLLTYDSFPKSIEVWNLQGNVAYVVASVPMEENIPIEGVRVGPRSVSWRVGYDNTLIWTEALDGGDPKKKVDHRDRMVQHAAPFSDQPQELIKIQHRSMGWTAFRDRNLLMVSDMDRDRRWIRSLLYDFSKPQDPPRVMVDRSMRDQYGDPGRIMTELDQAGFSVALQKGDQLFLAGQGASPEGYLPFLDTKNIQTLETSRLWRCQPGELESVSMIADFSESGKPVVLTRRESPSTPSNLFQRDLEKGTLEPLTDFRDPTPQIRGIKKQIVKYQRADGVPLSATLYLPADYKEGTRLPLLVWAYPLEFNDASTAGQVTASPNQFTRIGGISHLTLVTQGYAVMDNATMPVIGDPETMNDTFIEQIVGAAKAAIDKAAEMGVADPNRVAVGGHSYGAFMTANLMAHCDLFKAGVARSGAYNRTLTPFGFQSERRPLWEAKEIYLKLSPFMHADQIKNPLLLIHGENDNNPGTFPIQSQRMYQAVKGNGGTVRLVMLPYESHGYRARESVLHTQAEMIEWLDKYVKNAK